LKVYGKLTWLVFIVTSAQFVSFSNVCISQGSVATCFRLVEIVVMFS